eukprot:CAMPEP_0183776468 /NCGR_PEP_ID=MMETSP0739-20130205/46927_1 /TAXON_ID=385413 /ORGANISM="Thalassiosira miniscula, Strain CCMP1093" /LENGTH=43 /DNA_ID= /DNA_START= /DNA_END= /DNA_ORIENTATION=
MTKAPHSVSSIGSLKLNIPPTSMTISPSFMSPVRALGEPGKDL